MTKHPRYWGFRMNACDAALLVAAGPATWLLWEKLGPMAGCIPFVVGHFFLFCNIFRIVRWKELLWSAVCVVHVGTWAAADAIDWPMILLLQTPLTVGLVVSELRSPRYHGVAARRLNPALDAYLRGEA